MPKRIVRGMLLSVAAVVVLSVGGMFQSANADSYSDLILGDTPASYWRLNETTTPIAFDAATPAHNGGLVGGTDGSAITLGQPGALSCADNGSFQFPGVTSALTVGAHINVGDDANFERTDPFSIEGWFKTTYNNPLGLGFNGSFNPIISKVSFTAPATGRYNFPGYMLYVSSLGQLDFQLVSWLPIPGTPPDDPSLANLLEVQTSGSTWINGSWHHLVATYDGSSRASGVRFYVDGTVQPVAIANDNLSGSIRTTAPLYIGRKAGSFFNGNLDEVAVYNRILDAATVLAHYNAGVTCHASAGGDPAAEATMAAQLLTCNNLLDLCHTQLTNAILVVDSQSTALTADNEENFRLSSTLASCQLENVDLHGQVATCTAALGSATTSGSRKQLYAMPEAFNPTAAATTIYALYERMRDTTLRYGYYPDEWAMIEAISRVYTLGIYTPTRVAQLLHDISLEQLAFTSSSSPIRSISMTTVKTSGALRSLLIAEYLRQVATNPSGISSTEFSFWVDRESKGVVDALKRLRIGGRTTVDSYDTSEEFYKGCLRYRLGVGSAPCFAPGAESYDSSFY